MTALEYEGMVLILAAVAGLVWLLWR